MDEGKSVRNSSWMFAAYLSREGSTFACDDERVDEMGDPRDFSCL